MQLPDLVLDLDAYEQRLEAAIKSPRSQIFVDTSVMIWLYGLSPSARSEFTAWLRDNARKDRF